MKTAIAVAYIRVSTDMQTEYSPDSQLKLIKEYASKNNLNLTEIYSDEGISGRKADKRPAFKKMISDAKKSNLIQFLYIIPPALQEITRKVLYTAMC